MLLYGCFEFFFQIFFNFKKVVHVTSYNGDTWQC